MWFSEFVVSGFRKLVHSDQSADYYQSAVSWNTYVTCVPSPVNKLSLTFKLEANNHIKEDIGTIRL